MLRVAAVQMTSTPDVQANLAKARAFIDQALDRKADLIAFPENFTLMAPTALKLTRQAETIRGITVETLQEWAAENDIWILAGSVPLAGKKIKGRKVSKTTNTSLLISADGDIIARYDKIHLFDVNVTGDQQYLESATVQPGRKPVVADTPWGKFGLSICYDLRFPELYRKYADAGCDVIFIPSAFTVPTGKAHWDILTRARAVENQAYVVAPGQWGANHEGRETYGHTRIINPWGRVIAERPGGEGIVCADLNFEELEKIRKDLPALEHRRLK
jgi:nitrilase